MDIVWSSLFVCSRELVRSVLYVVFSSIICCTLYSTKQVLHISVAGQLQGETKLREALLMTGRCTRTFTEPCFLASLSLWIHFPADARVDRFSSSNHRTCSAPKPFYLYVNVLWPRQRQSRTNYRINQIHLDLSSHVRRVRCD